MPRASILPIDSTVQEMRPNHDRFTTENTENTERTERSSMYPLRLHRYPLLSGRLRMGQIEPRSDTRRLLCLRYTRGTCRLQQASGDGSMRKRIPKLRNPFWIYRWAGIDTFCQDAQSRIACVKDFPAAQCRAALRLPDLQKTVRLAIERRIRKLGKASVPSVYSVVTRSSAAADSGSPRANRGVKPGGPA